MSELLFIFMRTHAAQMYTPMSLLKLELSNPWWIIIFSTEKICSFFELVSLMAFFPRCTESRWMSVSLLSKYQRGNSSDLQKSRKQGCFCMSHPSGKQWAAVTTQQGEMREPPQRKLLSKIAATQGCDSTSVKDPFTILLALCSDLSPHDSSAKTPGMSSDKRREKERKKETTMPRTTQNYLYPVQQVWGVLLF